MKKVIKPVLLIIIIGIIAYFVFKIFLTPNDRFKAVNVVPKNSILLVEVDDPFNTWKQIGQTEIWSIFSENIFFEKINRNIQAADSMLSNNKMLFKAFGSRYMLMSLHQMDNNEFEPLIVADLERYSKLSSVKKYILGLNNENLNITNRKFEGFDIYEIFHKRNQDTYYLSFHKNLVIFTYNYRLIEDALTCIEEPVLGRNDYFLEIHNKLFGEGLVRLYLNYSLLVPYANKAENQVNSKIVDFLNSVYFSGFTIKADEDLFEIKGFTSFKKEEFSYLNALSKSGVGSFETQSIIPKSTRFLIRLGFSSFGEFLNSFEDLLKIEGLYDDYLNNYEKIEKKLNINIQNNFIDWIDDEITLLSVEPGHKNLQEELFLILKTKNKSSVVKNMEFINKQIKKHTPVVFTPVEYKGYTINYLQATGLIKLLFGKLFSKMDKPYYTIIDNYIVFSNHPQSVKNLINNYIAKETLDEWEVFQDFYRENFENKSNIFAFVNVPFTAESVYNNSSGKLRVNLRENRLNFQKIPFVALEMKFKDEFYKSQLIVFSKDSLYEKQLVKIKDRVVMLESESAELEQKLGVKQDSLHLISDEVQDPFTIGEIVIIDLKEKEHSEFFEDGSLKLIIEVSTGIKNGKYLEYYPNGEIKLKGKFENDRQAGTWRYYDEDGKLIEKKKF